jgi:hypothetical protein
MRIRADKRTRAQKRPFIKLACATVAPARPHRCIHPMLQLQRAIGNRAVQRVLQRHAEALQGRSSCREQRSQTAPANRSIQTYKPLPCGAAMPRASRGRGADARGQAVRNLIGSVSGQLIQRAVIPYRQITWADFLASPPNTPGAPEGAEILTKFDIIPSYTAKTTAKATKKKCRVEQTRATEVEATAAPDPADFNKPEAVMDQDQSWALARYTGDSRTYCASEGTKCEQQFDSIAARINTTCAQTADECKRAFDQGQKSFGYALGNDRVAVTSKGQCMTTLLAKCREFGIKRASLTIGTITVKTRADCTGSYIPQCLRHEVTERARLLRHEQGHFDITHVMAQNAQASLRARGASLSVRKIGCGEDAARDAARQEYNTNVRDVLTQLGRDWMRSKDQAQIDYDQQTNRGAKAAEQSGWEGKIRGGLKDYVPATAVPPTPAGSQERPR